MKDTWTERWDERYRSTEFAYGEQPNNFLKQQLEKLDQGSILFPAEGEGRNAVFAAKLGWKVAAFDISIEGKNKADQLAQANNVDIDYIVGGLEALDFEEAQFDVIALIYAHFPAAIKSHYHQALSKYLKKGGLIIFDAFSKQHLEYQKKNEKIGGPKDVASLFSIEEIKNNFPEYQVLELEEKVIELHEGLFHKGLGSVIRFVGRKM